MINIKEYVKTPSRALQFMIDGLERQSKRQDFKVDMSTFGHVDIDTNICLGCAATCAIQEIAGLDLYPEDIREIGYRAEALGFYLTELNNFEAVIDGARLGYLSALFEFFEMSEKSYKYDDLDLLPILTTDDWREKIPAVKKVIEQLKADGL